MEFQPKGWTLFLDRDGVINERIPGAYVEYPAQFVFTDKCLEAMAIFKKIFKRIVVVTNQQGIGKGGMSERQLQKVHNAMRSAVERAGGRIDGIYFCPDLEKFNPECRKPNTGMAFQAKADFPGIDFSKSVMVGDSISDMEFGKRLHMTTVLIEGKPQGEIPLALVDYRFASLFDFADSI